MSQAGLSSSAAVQDALSSQRDLEQEIKATELRLRQQELEAKKRDANEKQHWGARWSNPLVLAGVAALVGYLGTLITWSLARIDEAERHERTLALETEKLQGSLILDAVKTGEGSDRAARAAANLLLLADAKLIKLDDETRKKLQERAGDVGPGLPSSSPDPSGMFDRGVRGIDDARPVATLARDDPFRKAARSVGLLALENGSAATAFLVAEDLALTVAYATQSENPATLTLELDGMLHSYEVELPPLNAESDADGLAYSLVRVKGRPGAKHGWLKLRDAPPRAGESVGIILCRGTSQTLVVARTEDCRIFSMGVERFRHGCDTGGGSGGAPVLSGDGATVVGIHFLAEEATGEALRADLVARRIKRHLSPE